MHRQRPDSYGAPCLLCFSSVAVNLSEVILKFIKLFQCEATGFSKNFISCSVTEVLSIAHVTFERFCCNNMNTNHSPNIAAELLYTYASTCNITSFHNMQTAWFLKLMDVSNHCRSFLHLRNNFLSSDTDDAIKRVSFAYKITQHLDM